MDIDQLTNLLSSCSLIPQPSSSTYSTPPPSPSISNSPQTPPTPPPPLRLRRSGHRISLLPVFLDDVLAVVRAFLAVTILLILNLPNLTRVVAVTVAFTQLTELIQVRHVLLRNGKGKYWSIGYAPSIEWIAVCVFLILLRAIPLMFFILVAMGVEKYAIENQVIQACKHYSQNAAVQVAWILTLGERTWGHLKRWGGLGIIDDNVCHPIDWKLVLRKGAG